MVCVYECDTCKKGRIYEQRARDAAKNARRRKWREATFAGGQFDLYRLSFDPRTLHGREGSAVLLAGAVLFAAAVPLAGESSRQC